MKGLVFCSLLFVGLAALLGYAATNGFGASSPSFAPLTIISSGKPIPAPINARAEKIATPHKGRHEELVSEPISNSENAPTSDVESITEHAVVMSAHTSTRRTHRRNYDSTIRRRSTTRRVSKPIAKIETPKHEEPAAPRPSLAPTIGSHHGKDVTSG